MGTDIADAHAVTTARMITIQYFLHLQWHEYSEKDETSYRPHLGRAAELLLRFLWHSESAPRSSCMHRPQLFKKSGFQNNELKQS